MTMIETQPARETRGHDGDSGLSAQMLALLMRAGPADVASPAASAGQTVAGDMTVGRMTVGRVCEAEAGGAWRVAASSGGTVLARAAVSCLVKPQPDDLVQLYQTPAGCWVLAILERRGDASAVALDFGGSSVRLLARNVYVQALDQLSLEGARLESRANVVTQAAAERHAHVSGTDATHAGNAFVHAERHLGVHAGSAVVTAQALLKMDAGQIHMG
ncbi:DUF3540 domain-containing protein [Burkholderia cepacia]|uniref:DUF3540 domain-containing protein n=1 Tax=Burkholderia cepacia TaxID=292 RepID=UPI0026541631|nr:DUF3540 domain-containing protein [Burkholderia cepacia]MDN7638807.1 DUF3540 domain-containing protein [Burkholderia cepacia]